jgi:energy-coupling factor transporter transmembrane protein EcfT
MIGNYINYSGSQLKNYLKNIDILLLIFLVLFFNVSLVLKVVAIMGLFLLRFNFKLGLRLKDTRLPLLYPALILIAFFNILINKDFSLTYLFLFSLGIFIWLIAFLAMHQMKLAVEINSLHKIENTIDIFIIINFLANIFQLLSIIIETGHINPYTFEGMHLKYGASTGDYIKGIFLDSSNVNGLINLFALFYFLHKRKYVLSFLPFIIFLFTTSNLLNIILVSFFAVIFLIDKCQLKKTVILCYSGLLLIFLLKISPSNFKYTMNRFEELIVELKNEFEKQLANEDNEELKEIEKNSQDSINPVILENIPKSVEENLESDNIYQARISDSLLVLKAQFIEQQGINSRKIVDYAFLSGLNNFHQKMIYFSNSIYGDSLSYIEEKYKLTYPGKVVSVFQVFDFFRENPKKLLLGAGLGNFSSKLAIKATGLGLFGSYPESKIFISDHFKDYHLKTITYTYIKPPSEHSITNTPNSAYNQIFSEYGIMGVMSLIFLYVGFFLKRWKNLSYGKTLLPLFLICLATDYWFEYLSIVVFFELLMFVDIEKNKNNTEWKA